MLITKDEMRDIEKKIIELYPSDYTVLEISVAVGRCSKFVAAKIKELKERGALPAGRRFKRVKKRENVPTANRHTGEGKTTLKDGQTVNCTIDVSKTCIYGIGRIDPNSQDLCHYCLVTGHRRGCSHTACDKYGKISKDNPRREFGSRVGKC